MSGVSQEVKLIKVIHHTVLLLYVTLVCPLHVNELPVSIDKHSVPAMVDFFLSDVVTGAVSDAFSPTIDGHTMESGVSEMQIQMQTSKNISKKKKKTRIKTVVKIIKNAI